MKVNFNNLTDEQRASMMAQLQQPAAASPAFDRADFHRRLLEAGNSESKFDVMFDCAAGRVIPAEVIEEEVKELRAANIWVTSKGKPAEWRYNEVRNILSAGPVLPALKAEAEAVYAEDKPRRGGSVVSLVKAAVKRLATADNDAPLSPQNAIALALTDDTFNEIPDDTQGRKSMKKAQADVQEALDLIEGLTADQVEKINDFLSLTF